MSSCIFNRVSVVTRPAAGLAEAEAPVKGDGGSVGGADFQPNLPGLRPDRIVREGYGGEGERFPGAGWQAATATVSSSAWGGSRLATAKP